MVRKLFCFVLLFVTVANTAALQKCQGAAECITLESCTGLYSTLLLPGGNTQKTKIIKLLKSLHCGFDYFKPMICCPPEFRPTPVADSRDNFPDYANTEPDSENVLHDGQICGIQTQDRTLAKHPWTVLLRYEKTIGWGFFCGGVLISTKYVLTTASCVIGEDLPSTWVLNQVRLGEWDISTSKDCDRYECNNPYLDMNIEKIIIHDSYVPSSKNQYYDIALLRLAQNVQVTDYIKPICLPMASRTSTFEDYVVEVAGWGTIEHYNSKVKKISALPIIGTAECSSILGRDIKENQICAGGARDSDTCVGDLGGALMGHVSNESNWLALGLLSYRPTSCGSPEFPSVYTRVDAYLNWIANNMEP